MNGDDALVVQCTAPNPSAPVISSTSTSVPFFRVSLPADSFTHVLKHQRPLTAISSKPSSLNSVYPSVREERDEDPALHTHAGPQFTLTEMICNADGVFTCPENVLSYRDIIINIKKELDLWSDALPTYSSVITRVRDVVDEIMMRNITQEAERLHNRENEALRTAIDDVSAPYAKRIEELTKRAQEATSEMASLRDERLRREHDEAQRLNAIKQEIAQVKAVFEDREGKSVVGNDRIQAFYNKNREFRQIMARKDDVEADITELLHINETLTKQKTALTEEIRDEFDSIDPSVAALAEQKSAAEGRVHLRSNKKLTVQRHIEKLNAELKVQEETLQQLIERNENLCNEREEWGSRIARIEADALREYTPRPSWNPSANKSNNFEGSFTPASFGTVHPSSNPFSSFVSPMSEFVEIRPGMSSAQIVDVALKKLTNYMNNTKKSVEEWLRLSQVLEPVLRCSTTCQVVERSRMDGETDNIVIREYHFHQLPIGLVLPPGPDFSIISSRLTVGNAVTFADSKMISFRNERWTQCATERQAIAMMLAVSSTQISAATPLQMASDALAKWCAGSPERDAVATGFGVNLLTSLRMFSGTSAICRAAYMMCFGQLPLCFGESILSHIHDLFSQVEGSSTAGLIALKTVMPVFTRGYHKDRLLSQQQVQQAKFSLASDAASTGVMIKLASVFELVEQKRNSGLFLRCVFSQFLDQHYHVMCSLFESVHEISKSSPVLKMLVVSESAMRSRWEGMRWDAEVKLSNGLRYGGAASSKRMVGLHGRSAFVDAVTLGLPRFDAHMLRIFDEELILSSNEAPQSSGKRDGGTSQSKKGEYLCTDDVCTRLRCVMFKLSTV